jgi:sRNA-binding protein
MKLRGTKSREAAMATYSLREDRDRAIQALAAEYPKTFFTVGERRKPLKHGIEKDIEAELARDNDHPLLDHDIADALAWYRSHVGYQKSCSVAGDSRIDLHGKAVSKVTPSEALEVEAEGEAAEIFAQMAERRKAGNGLPPAMLSPTTRVVAKASTISVNTALDNTELFAELEKQLSLVRTVLGADPDDLLRKQLARSALQLMADPVRSQNTGRTSQ